MLDRLVTFTEPVVGAATHTALLQEEPELHDEHAEPEPPQA